jgi:hypothetical protein
MARQQTAAGRLAMGDIGNNMKTLPWLTAAIAIAGGLLCMSAGSSWAADFSGKWLPATDLDAPLKAADLRLASKAKAALESFDARREDSTRYCMPYGTPRNTLATAPYPIEILQRPERLTIVFDRLGDVRRIFLDGRARPENLWPTWLGNSLGHWQGETLVIDTLAMTTESILNEQGLPHSEDMRLGERLSLVKMKGAELLRDEITITDSAMYDAPIKVTRFFRRAPDVQMSEGSALCLLDQWRKRLEARNRDLALGTARVGEPESGGGQ